ncbi:RNA pseudouridine synthase D3 [Homo sapiens]|uniref:Isoform 2 of Mitochondrial mRNA pseudouridine synthase RPUSD3 n=2 Tax=Homo sapiens TaxID=9606 RepID=Q6P087-2|nr:RNA pseudouridine synthase D3 [Homo sapiens]KAI4028194.1 RNA pseudouridine synthase D3 [Homo sapiens]|eukprot:NP_001136019.1 mitochondrial mRNA pseudouridine synthase RPUSD3 isoform 2 [Homo sapiens]
MRAVLAREMDGRRVLGRFWSGWRRGLGVRPVPEDAGFGTEARHQRQPRGSCQRSGPLGDQPFAGLLPKNLSREELVDALRAAVVDRKGKPGELTLFSVLPELSQSLGLREQELQVVRASGKESSGLVLLSSCPQTASRLQKYFTHARRAQRPTATYCAVTDGIPAASEGKIQAALKLEHIDGVNLTVPVKAPSRKDILEGVKKTLSHFRVVATGSGCALVQLQPLTVFSSQLQVHMVLQLCPVLGDHMYSARVGTVLGQRFLLPAENNKPQRQVLDEALLRRLHLTPSQAAQLPLHLHLHRLLLPGTRARDTPVELLAPLPPYFSRTLQCLGLRLQ